jgi:hypothetical protein
MGFPSTGSGLRQELEPIGASVQGRSIVVHRCGHPDGLRILIVAGQHGDEPDAREAAAVILEGCRSGAARSIASLAVIVDANPDGAVAMTRTNACATDLNRDHLLVSEPETLALHSFVHRWLPDLVVDVHTYRPGQPALMPYGLLFPHDVMIDFPTNPAVGDLVPRRRQTQMINVLMSRLQETSIRCARYTLVRRSGIVRHSNTDILDARNGLALRYGVFTVLLEGRRSTPHDPPTFIPPHLALARCLQILVEFAAKNAALFRRRPGEPQVGDAIPVKCRYAGFGAPCLMEMQSLNDGGIALTSVPGRYLPAIVTTKRIRTPVAYGVPRALPGLLAVLERHRFNNVPLSHLPQPATGEVYEVRLAEARTSEAPSNRLLCAPRAVRLDADEHVFFPTGQSGGRALTVLLEPQSQFGLQRFAACGLALRPDTLYPIVRVHE